MESLAGALDESKQQIKQMLQMALQELTKGDLSKCANICRDVLRKDQQCAEAINLLGCVLVQHGDFEKAQNYFSAALTLEPDNPGFMLNAGRALIYTRERKKADALLKEAAQKHPDNAQIHYWYAQAQQDVGKLKEAALSFERVVELESNHPNAMTSLASLYERMNELDNVPPVIERLKQSRGKIPAYLMLEAKLHRRDKELETAREKLSELLSYELAPGLEAHVQNELGKVLEAMGHYDEAYLAFSQSQELLLEVRDRQPKMTDRFINALNVSLDYYSNKESLSLRPYTPPEDGREAPVFFVGFPRSGTTLTEQILSAHPHFDSTQEASLVEGVISAMPQILQQTIYYPKIVEELTDEQIGMLRDHYFKSLEEVFDGDISGKRIVDKMPFNINHLGLIHRLFPEAKMLVLIRDPRDVCLSCFKQNFTNNPAMAEFYTLKNTMDVYDKTMRHYQNLTRLFPLNHYEFRYEDLIADTETVSKEIMAYLGEEWSEEMLTFYTPDKNRYVRTPSYEGVMKPVYKDAAGRWKHYEAYLAPHMQCLEKHIEHYGYEPSHNKDEA